jgi:hypothetical protein
VGCPTTSPHLWHCCPLQRFHFKWQSFSPNKRRWKWHRNAKGDLKCIAIQKFVLSNNVPPKWHRSPKEKKGENDTVMGKRYMWLSALTATNPYHALKIYC